MTSQQLPFGEGSQYDRLVVVLAELRERGRRILAEAQSARNVSIDLRHALGDQSHAQPEKVRPAR